VRIEHIGDATLYLGDCLEILPTLDSESVHCCVTSPPYYGLRDYGHDDQIGLEGSPDEYVDKLVSVFRDVRRVLRNDGTLWLNLGDSYAGGGNYRGVNSEDTLTSKQNSNRGARGLSQNLVAKKEKMGACKPKDLMGIPWRVAFALQADGWYLRQDIIWHKPNPMPESVTDRCTKAHEYIFMLSKRARYYYDAEAIAEPFADDRMGNPGAYDRTTSAAKGACNDRQDLGFLNNGRGWNKDGSRTNRNRRSVWTVATKPYPDAHFATFPPALIEPCILAGCPVGGVVLDIFSGSGTTGEVAANLSRGYAGIELNPDYQLLGCERITAAYAQGRLFA
jgi:DNA modification methylase